MFLDKQLAEITVLIEKAHIEKKSVSTKGIDWHLDHSLKVINTVFDSLKKSNPSEYKSKFNLIRFCTYTLNWFPRGKGRAPKIVQSFEKISKNDLLQQLEEVTEKSNSILNLPEKSNFKHPYFGVLNLKQTKKFLKLHTIHHLKICRDILK